MKNLAIMAGFNIMIRDSGLLFGPLCIRTCQENTRYECL